MKKKEPVLAGSKLNKKYKSRDREVRPLDDVSFELYSREILGIVGESGSGKSTLLKVICGIERADTGTLYHNGEEYTGVGPAETGGFMQMIFQDAYASFDPRMSMERSLLEGKKAGRSEMLRVINEVGLSDELLGRRPKHISGGQCQRMSIARALLSNAEVLLCDEITSALDVTTQAQVIRLLTDVRDGEGVSIIMVSHDLALVSMLCDRIMVMKDGRIIEQGKTSEVIASPADAYTRSLIDSILEV